MVPAPQRPVPLEHSLLGVLLAPSPPGCRIGRPDLGRECCTLEPQALELGRKSGDSNGLNLPRMGWRPPEGLGAYEVLVRR